MFFKAKFSIPIEENVIDNFNIDFNSLTGRETIYYKNHEFEIERTNSGLVNELIYCNQCVLTYDIEEVFIEFISKILLEDHEVTLFDSRGFQEVLTREELPTD